jgi:hypothetical protein
VWSLTGCVLGAALENDNERIEWSSAKTPCAPPPHASPCSLSAACLRTTHLILTEHTASLSPPMRGADSDGVRGGRDVFSWVSLDDAGKIDSDDYATDDDCAQRLEAALRR